MKETGSEPRRSSSGSSADVTSWSRERESQRVRERKSVGAGARSCRCDTGRVPELVELATDLLGDRLELVEPLSAEGSRNTVVRTRVATGRLAGRADRQADGRFRWAAGAERRSTAVLPG